MSLRPPPESLESDLSRCFDRGLRLSERREPRFLALPNFERLEVGPNSGKRALSGLSKASVIQDIYDADGCIKLTKLDKQRASERAQHEVDTERTHAATRPGVTRAPPAPPFIEEADSCADFALKRLLPFENFIFYVRMSNPQLKDLDEFISIIFLSYAENYDLGVPIYDFKYMEKFIRTELMKWLDKINNEYLQGTTEEEFWKAVNEYYEALESRNSLVLHDRQVIENLRQKTRTLFDNHIMPAYNGVRDRIVVKRIIINYYKAYKTLVDKFKNFVEDVNKALESNGCDDGKYGNFSLYKEISRILDDPTKNVYEQLLPHYNEFDNLMMVTAKKMELLERIHLTT